MGGEGVVLLDPAVHQLLHLPYLFACHPSRQIEVEAQPLSLHTSHVMSRVEAPSSRGGVQGEGARNMLMGGYCGVQSIIMTDNHDAITGNARVQDIGGWTLCVPVFVTRGGMMVGS